MSESKLQHLHPEIINYYKSIKANGLKSPKMENNEEFITTLDRVEDDFKIPFISTYVLINNAYRHELSSNRAKSIKQNIHAIREAKDVKIRTEVTAKVNKFEFIPSHFYTCSSKAIKVAVALFLRPAYTETLKRDFIFSLLNHHSKTHTVSDVIDLCQKTIGDVRAFIKTVGNLNTTEKQRKQLICGLIECSELLRDRLCSKLAISVSLNGYISLISLYLKHGHLKNVIPFEPLINLYVKESIAKCTQEEERVKILNQFKVDPVATIDDVIKGLPPAPNKVSNSSTKSCVFKPDQNYQYYKGAPNYTRDIITTYHIEHGRRYRIQTYNDCLYDVLGYTLEAPNFLEATHSPTTNGISAIEHEIYDRMSWSDRLNLIRFRTKIRIEDAKGSELNDYHGNSTDITISWFDDNEISCSKTISLKKSDNKK
uniref:Putative gp83-like protein n=1 Tax=Kallithea virus TaxID=1654582 RepID=A0A0F7KMW6_9VIRU|nr:putative gp83-like protein [Kallithea virus]